MRGCLKKFMSEKIVLSRCGCGRCHEQVVFSMLLLIFTHSCLNGILFAQGLLAMGCIG